ncbi:MAG: lysoplasmalogenase [Crocinitomicaceae bacterium]|nr:lysoplasmalogenase [Crocinitomicaceae bacterium]
MKQIIYRGIFIIVSILYLVLLLLKQSDITTYMKPLLMLPLVFAVGLHTPFPSKKWLIGALLFSWLGDVILIFSDIAVLFFIAGLIAFLITHIFFISLFLIEKGKENSANGLLIAGSILIISYFYVFVSLLIPCLGEMKIPVIIYGAVVSCMLLTLLCRFPGWVSPGKNLVLAGAVTFVVSDSLLAINKFYYPFWEASFFIMFSYLAAQFSIVTGFLKMKAGTRNSELGRS